MHNNKTINTQRLESVVNIFTSLSVSALILTLTSFMLTMATSVYSRANDGISVHTLEQSIPISVVQVMKEKNLDDDAFSFVVTPLTYPAQNKQTNSKSNGKSDRLPIEDAQQKLLAQQIVQNKAQALHQPLDQLFDESLHTPVEHALARLTHTHSYLAQQPRTPASTMKLIPTFVALDTLGKDFVWSTKVYKTGYTVGNTLHGNLIIKGSGDPKFTHNKLENLLYKVKKLGIEHIEGDIIIDSSIFTNVSKNPATFDNDPLRPYNASPDGMLVNFSTITIDTYPSLAHRSQLVYQPMLNDIKLPQTIAHRRGRCQSIKHSLRPVWHDDKLVFNKRIPSTCGHHSFYIAYPDAKKFAVQVVKDKWLGLGNTVTGRVRNQENNQKIQQYSTMPTVKIHSPFAIANELSYPLHKQIYDINHYSNNVMTEQLLLSISAYQHYNTNHTAVHSNYPTALRAVNDWWIQNLRSAPPYMTNGSGLCRTCSVTASNVNDLLGKAYQHPDFAVYVNSLGIAGVSGTISTHKYRRPHSAAIGRAWIKTGTLSNVTAMAGYVKGRSGQEYSVVGIINLPQGTKGANQKRPVLDALIDWVAQH